MNTINTQEAKKYIIDILPQAGKILKDYFYNRNYTHKSKGGFDFLTQADANTDAFILDKLQIKFPNANFLTEETAPKDYSSFKDRNNVWIVDPLDGTINFSRGTPHFAISIALVHAGIPELGIIYLPMTDDVFWANRENATAYKNDKQVDVSLTDDLGECVIACDWAWNLDKRKNVVRWLGEISPHVRQIKSMGSAVADLAQLASGRIDGYIHSGLKPWDVAAAGLLVEKAGGKITTPAGKHWNVFEPDMLATNTVIHDKILSLIN